MMPRLYAIVDAGVLAARGILLADFAHELRVAGVELVQYRDKQGSPQEVLQAAKVLRAGLAEGDSPRAKLIMNDRSDLGLLTKYDGVHVGQGDLLPEDARRVVGASRWVGVSTHTDDQVRAADLTSADYIAIGPVFATGTKPDAEQAVGLEGVGRARTLTAKPLVAIGGITRTNARSVIEAGADSVAVISGLFAANETIEEVARDFIELLG